MLDNKNKRTIILGFNETEESTQKFNNYELIQDKAFDLEAEIILNFFEYNEDDEGNSFYILYY